MTLFPVNARDIDGFIALDIPSRRRYVVNKAAASSTCLLYTSHYHVRSEGQIVKKAVYIAIGIDLDGRKDVLGMCCLLYTSRCV